MYFEFINVGDIMLLWLLFVVFFVEYAFHLCLCFLTLDTIYLTYEISGLLNIKKKFILALFSQAFVIFSIINFCNSLGLIMR